MNTINHHLTDSLLMGYAAGTLPEAFSLIVATHVSLCDECRARLESFEAVGGSLIETGGAEPMAMAEGSLSAVMARIDAGADEISLPAPKPTGIYPAPLADYLREDGAGLKWRNLGGGARHAVLETEGSATARLLHIPAGMKLPDHGHNGLEATLVLQGAFRDDDGRFARGDIEIADEELDHTPVAEDHEDCICLAVTDAPLKFNSWIPRIAQPFLGI